MELMEENREQNLCVCSMCRLGKKDKVCNAEFKLFALTLSLLVHVLKLCAFMKRNQVVLHHKSVFIVWKILEVPVFRPALLWE